MGVLHVRSTLRHRSPINPLLHFPGPCIPWRYRFFRLLPLFTIIQSWRDFILLLIFCDVLFEPTWDHVFERVVGLADGFVAFRCISGVILSCFDCDCYGLAVVWRVNLLAVDWLVFGWDRGFWGGFVARVVARYGAGVLYGVAVGWVVVLPVVRWSAGLLILRTNGDFFISFVRFWIQWLQCQDPVMARYYIFCLYLSKAMFLRAIIYLLFF